MKRILSVLCTFFFLAFIAPHNVIICDAVSLLVASSYDEIDALESPLVPTASPASRNAGSFDGGDGSLDDPFLISSADQLSLTWGGQHHYKLTNDITLENQWQPIGNFAGHFDGSLFTIKNLNILNGTCVGLFFNNSGTIKNLKIQIGILGINSEDNGDVFSGGVVGYNQGTIINCSVEGFISAISTTASAYAGGIAGYNAGGVIENCMVDVNVNATANDSPSKNMFVGGVTGNNNQGVIKGCTVDGTISSTAISANSYSGGIAGYNSSGSIDQCSVTASVFADAGGTENVFALAGGITATNETETATITNCETMGDVSSLSASGVYAAGIVSYNPGGKVDYCHALGSVSANTRETTPKEWMTYSFAGGIVAYSLANAEIKNSHAEGDILAHSDSKNAYVAAGGVVANNVGASIYNSSSYGDVNTQTTYIQDSYQAFQYTGGFVGVNQGLIEKSFSKGKSSTTATSFASNPSYDRCTGGFVGWNYGGAITDCYAGGEAYGGGYAGGFVGFNHASITNCYSVGKVSAGSSMGGFCGEFDADSTIENCYFDLNSSGQWKGGGTAVNTPLMRSEKTYFNWRFGEIWFIDLEENNGYPMLIWQLSPAQVAVESVVFAQSTAQLYLDESVILVPIITPSNATVKRLTWFSSEPSVVTVSQSGQVTALKNGSAIIYARSVSNPEIKAECVVTIVADIVVATDIVLSHEGAGLAVGEKLALSATIFPRDSNNKNMIWYSSNRNVATVSSTGEVTAVSAGVADIVVNSVGNQHVTAVCRVVVGAANVVVTGIQSEESQQKPIALSIGKSTILRASVLPVNAANQSIEWMVSPPDVATVINGVVTALKQGDATVTAQTLDGGYSASWNIVVPSQSIVAQGVVSRREIIELQVGQEQFFEAYITPEGVKDTVLRYESVHPSIATITRTGFIQGVSPGRTFVRAISGTGAGRLVAYATVDVTEQPGSLSQIKLDKDSLTLVEGRSEKVAVELMPFDWSNKAPDRTIEWDSSDWSVAYVRDGTIVAIKPGAATITATASASGKSAKCVVSVVADTTALRLRPTDRDVLDKGIKAGELLAVNVDILANTGGSLLTLTLEYDNKLMFPVSYEKGVAMERQGNVLTNLMTDDFGTKTEVGFILSDLEARDGTLITVYFSTLQSGLAASPELQATLKTRDVNFTTDGTKKLSDVNCIIALKDYVIGDINEDGEIDLRDAFLLERFLNSEEQELTPSQLRAAYKVYAEYDGQTEVTQPNLLDLQTLIQQLAEWQMISDEPDDIVSDSSIQLTNDNVVQIGQDFELKAIMNSGVVHGGKMYITFDGHRVTPVDIVKGELLGEDDQIAWNIQKDYQQTDVIVVTWLAREPIEQSGQLFKIIFTARNNGVGVFGAEVATMYNEQMMQINSASEGGWIKIGNDDPDSVIQLDYSHNSLTQSGANISGNFGVDLYSGRAELIPVNVMLGLYDQEGRLLHGDVVKTTLNYGVDSDIDFGNISAVNHTQTFNIKVLTWHDDMMPL